MVQFCRFCTKERVAVVTFERYSPLLEFNVCLGHWRDLGDAVEGVGPYQRPSETEF